MSRPHGQPLGQVDKMKGTFLEASGTLVSADELRLPKAKSLAGALVTGVIQFAQLLECRRISDEEEAVVFEVDVEVPQIRVYEIEHRERIAAIFSASDEVMPKVEALRADFPRVPHLNLHRQEYPRDLCLYEESYRDLKRQWTAPRFVRRIREWLALTAKGELHQPDQPLEPLLLDYWGHIVLPHDIAQASGSTQRLYVTVPPHGIEGRPFLMAQREVPSDAKSIRHVTSVHQCPPQVHGLISRCPTTLAELADLIRPVGRDLIAEVRDSLNHWKSEAPNLLDLHPLVIIVFPQTREEGGPVERVDVWAFLLTEDVRSIGCKLGIWQVHGGTLGTILSPDASKRGQDIAVAVLNTSTALTQSMAATLNGGSCNHSVPAIAIGVGALGSQIVINLSRCGFGTWTLIDRDRLMPHNVARHALDGGFVGWHKADGVVLVANTIIADRNAFTALRADVLSPGSRKDELGAVLKTSDLILDMSASVAVARSLACDIESPARRVSLFMAPSGQDLVLLCEDRYRSVQLDALEMQYYRAILHDTRLQGHLERSKGRHRYGQSCADITASLPHSLVALHAAIGAHAVQQMSEQAEAAITVWRADIARNVLRIDVKPRIAYRHPFNLWSVIVDEGILETIFNHREEKLLNETGGVLIGSFDLDRRLIYIVDALPSPPDSTEWPTLYIRGCRGLQDAVNKIATNTDGMLEYVGEWHSHPRGATTAPSKDDMLVFEWLATLMKADGLPAVMMIAGDGGRASCFVNEIGEEENPIQAGQYRG